MKKKKSEKVGLKQQGGRKNGWGWKGKKRKKNIKKRRQLQKKEKTKNKEMGTWFLKNHSIKKGNKKK